MLREGQDLALLIHFDRDVELSQDLTSSHQKLEFALKSRVVAQHPADDSGSVGGLGGYQRVRGGTRLYDAIFFASDEGMRKQKGRRALVIPSDGLDRGSKATLKQAVEAAQRSDTIVYSILFADAEAYSLGRFGQPGADDNGRECGGAPSRI